MKTIEQYISNSNISPYLHMINLYDEETYNHCIMVGTFVKAFLENNDEYSMQEKDAIIEGSLILDLGKIYIPFGIAKTKDRDITEDEYELIKSHCLIGKLMLKDTALSDITKNIVYKHHLLLNGKGYPVNEKVEDDEKYIWIVATIDKFCAITENRFYRKGKSYSTGYSEIVKMCKEDKALPYNNLKTLKNIIETYQIKETDDELNFY